MSLKYSLAMNINSAFILLIILYQSSKYNEKSYYSNKLFTRVLKLSLLMLLADTLGRFDGDKYRIYYFLNSIGNYFLFIMIPIIPSVWLRYAHFQVFKNEKRSNYLLYIIGTINLINVIIVMITQVTGWYYYIDTNNIYHRGQYYLLSNIFNYSLLAVGFYLIIKNKKIIDQKFYYSLVFFSIPPLIATILQSMFYGLPLLLSGLVISIIIVYLNIQNHSIYLDYLTEASNRRKLHTFIKNRIDMANNKKSFTAVMLDLDDFKKINDTFGHDEGDVALQTTVKLIKKHLGKNDLIARSGGDEFWIILDNDQKEEVENIIENIKNSFSQWNRENQKKYILQFSYGFAIYDVDRNWGIDKFQAQVDNLMYENKKISKKPVLR